MKRGSMRCISVLAPALLIALAATSEWVSAQTVSHLVRGNVNNLEHYEKARAAFYEIHPGITIDFELVDPNDYVESLLVRVAAGSPPDVAWSAGSFFAQLAVSGNVVNLGPLVARSGLDLSRYYPEAVSAARFEGTLYALPYQTHPGIHGMLYNADLFAVNGLADPTGDWTYDDFLAAARAITRDDTGDGVTDRWGFSIELGGVESDSMILSLGGRYVNEAGTESQAATPETVNAFQFFADMVHQYGVVPMPGEAEWWVPLFTKGNLGMALIGPWHLGILNDVNVGFDARVANIPQGPNGRIAGGPSTDLYVVLAGSDDPEAAFEWIEFLVSEEGLLIQTDYLSNPTPINHINQFLIEQFGNAYDPFIAGLAQGTYQDALKVHNHEGGEARRIVHTGVRPIWTGQESPATALQNVDSLLNALLRE